MLVDRSHRRWMVMTVALSLCCTILYAVYARSVPNGPHGGSWQGLLFGIVGSVCMIYAGLLSGRKALPGSRFGTVQFWLKGHIWIGLLSVPLILFHSGFRVGGGLEQILMACFLLVIVSGVYGLLLQQFLPRLMSELVPAQAIAEQIPVVCRRLKESADAKVFSGCGAAATDVQGPARLENSPERELFEFYSDWVRSFLEPRARPDHPMFNRTFALTQLSRMEGSMPERLQPVVQEIRTAYEERRQLMAQSRIHFWMHNWLLLHVPLSVALLVLGIVHALMSVYY